MRFHSTDYKKDKYPDIGLLNRGYWLNIGDKEFHSQVVIGKGVHDLGFSIGVGGEYSETPIDLAFYIPGVSVYLNTSMFGKFCERLTHTKQDIYNSRQIQFILDISKEDKRLHIYPWSKKMMWSASDPKWVQGWYINLSPVDKIFGPKRYSYLDIDKSQGIVKLPENDYAVELTLQEQTLARPRGRKRVKSYVVDWNAWEKEGIPTKPGNRGRILGSAVKVTNHSIDNKNWVNEACANIASQTQEDRSRYLSG